MWPMAMAPAKERNYRGDLDLEAQFYTAVTGQKVTLDDLYKAGERIMTLQRANTVRGMKDKDGNVGCNDLRGVHVVITEWVFEKDPEIEPFTPGTDKMERKDWKKALTMLYKRVGWDEKLGCPTKECLKDLGMDDVAEDLESRGLLTEGGVASRVPRPAHRGWRCLRQAHPHLRSHSREVLRRQPGAVRLSRLR